MKYELYQADTDEKFEIKSVKVTTEHITHITVLGKVVEYDEKFVEINNLQDLQNLIKEVGNKIIMDEHSIKIYNGYVE